MAILGPGDRLRVAQALRAAFDLAPLSSLVAAPPLNRRYEDYIERNQTPSEEVHSLVRRADEEGWVMQLLASAERARQGDAQLAQIHAELRSQAPNPNLDPYLACCLTNSYVMVNRTSLRS